MTTLTITPKYEKKTAKFEGTVAAGEQVAVTVADPNGKIGSTTNLRLRAVGFRGETLAQFPMPVEEGETPDTWTSGTGTYSCTLNLNTTQMLLAVPPAATMRILFVLDDAETGILYFKDFCGVEHWPRRVGEDEPVDLSGYRDFVEETQVAITAAQSAVEASQTIAQAAADRAAAAEANAATAATAAQQAASSLSGAVKRQIVQSLPTESIDPNTIYMVPRADSEEGNAYNEWMYINGEWEKIGDTRCAEDYTALSNKPQIGGVELVGNKTAEQLGLATTEDIPDVPSVDSELSPTSTNPVQNRVVKDALDQKLSLSGGMMSGNINLGSSIITSDGAIAIPLGTSDGAIGSSVTFPQIIAAVNLLGIGQYNHSTTYAIGDLCWYRLQGRIYVRRCKQVCTGNNPLDTTYWEEVTLLSLLSKYLSLAGGTMTGDIIIGSDAIHAPGEMETDASLRSTNKSATFLEIIRTALGTNTAYAQASALLTKLNSTSAAPAWQASPSTPYTVDDLVTYNGILYKLTAASPTGSDPATDTAHWTATTIADNLGAIDPEVLNSKLNGSSAAPAYDATATYAVGEYCTYNGTLYICNTAIITAEAWTAAHWTETDMTTPDATLDVGNDGVLRVYDANGSTVLWNQMALTRYARAATSTTTPADRAVSLCTLPTATDDTIGTTEVVSATIEIPTITSLAKVTDFILDVYNPNINATGTIEFNNLNTTYTILVPLGDDLSDLTTLNGGTMARFALSLTSFPVLVGNTMLPAYHIQRITVVKGVAE